MPYFFFSLSRITTHSQIHAHTFSYSLTHSLTHTHTYTHTHTHTHTHTQANSTIFVGLSKRTNMHGLHYLERLFGMHTPFRMHVVGVPVVGALHLKSLLTWGGPEIG